MKLAIGLGLLLPILSFASPAVETAVQSYSAKVYADYSLATEKAERLRDAVNLFVARPSEVTLDAAKVMWKHARSAYSPTEVYRFYEGPIDDADGPEGLINAWPLDEAYIDYVLGKEDSGIINHPELYPEITKELLVSLNEKDGEKNISTGFHAMEFLLWGQDFNPNGPGNRPVKDYVVGQGVNADRRGQYLLVLADLLVDHLASLRDDWAPQGDTYGRSFAGSEQEGLAKILLGAYRLAGEELAHERMFVAYDTQQQEDEHSCFSDTTHLDLLHNFQGIQSVLLAVGGPHDLLLAVNPAQAAALKKATLAAATNMAMIPGPFDRAIYSEEGRKAILAAVTSLEDLAVEIRAGAAALGIALE